MTIERATEADLLNDDEAVQFVCELGIRLLALPDVWRPRPPDRETVRGVLPGDERG